MRHALDASNDSLCAELAALTGDDARVAAACRRAAAVWDGDVTRARGARAALVLHEIGADRTTLIACILSDPRLLAAVDPAALSAEFGGVAANFVAQMQRLMQLGEQYRRAQSSDWIENLRRLLLSSIQDVRVMVIQLVHRLERLRGLAFEPDEAKRRQIAAETRDVYAPIAHRLGLGQIKWELEDLAFRHLEPATYKRIASLLEEKRAEREAYLKQVRQNVTEALKAVGIAAKVAGRPKHIASIWGKMQRKKLSFEALFDVRAVRIEVDTIADCYAALSVVHSVFVPIDSEYDDYIARPKDNGYQSLHTAVLAQQGKAVEVQIRTSAMHAQAELGVAAHWRYKEGGGAVDSFAAELNRLRQALEVGNGAAPVAAEVYVFTPQGDIFALPLGSTVLDYAYRVHTLVGHRCKGAKINGQIVPLKTVLNQADRVEILTQTHPAPSREWGSAQTGFLYSASARAKVRNWFHRVDQSAARAAGAAQCERLFRRLGLNRSAQNALLAALNFKSMEALFDAVGLHRLDATTLLRTARLVLKPATPEPSAKAALRLDQTPSMGLSLDGMKAEPAGCCHPRPGDAVRAFITRGQGFRLHKVDCRNLIHLAEQYPERVLAVDWPSGQTAWAQTLRLDVLVDDVARFWSDLGPVLVPFKARILESRSRLERNSGLNDIALHIELPDAVDVQPLMKRLQGLPSVESVQRRAV